MCNDGPVDEGMVITSAHPFHHIITRAFIDMIKQTLHCTTRTRVGIEHG